MSADNWAVCPQCHAEREKNIEKRAGEINAQYGKVGRDKFIKMSDELNKFSEQKEQTTLREDYEQGIIDGEYYLRYSASCTVCGWSFKKKIDEKVTVKK